MIHVQYIMYGIISSGYSNRLYDNHWNKHKPDFNTPY